MPASSTKSLGRFVAGFWVVNLILGLLIIGTWLLSGNPAVRAFFVSPTPTFTETFTPTVTLTFTNTFTPSSTGTPTFHPNPSETFTPRITPTDTLTPVPFSEGPIIIGYSVQKPAAGSLSIWNRTN